MKRKITKKFTCVHPHLPVAVMHARQSRKCSLGTLVKEKELGSGASSVVYWVSVLLPRQKYAKKSTMVLKQVDFTETQISALYAWDRAGLSSPMDVKFPLQHSCIKQIAFDSNQLESNKTHCIVSVDASIDCSKPLHILRTNTFLAEVGVSACLDHHVNPHLPYPTFCTAVDSWTSSNYGNILMPYVGRSLETILEQDALSLRVVQSLVLQVLIALSWAQHTVQFKHHDLHTGNAFVTKRRIPSEWNTPSGRRYQLPDASFALHIADFGLSAATDPASSTRIARLDYSLLEVDNDRSWGQWTHDLQKYEGYDMTYFLSSLLQDLTSAQPALKSWVGSVIKAIRTLDPALRISNDHDRPLGFVRVTPDRLLQHPVFAPFCVDKTSSTI